MARKLIVEVIGDTSSLSHALRTAGDDTRGFSGALTKFAKAGTLALGTAGIAGALVVFKRGFDEAMDSAKVMAQTGAVLESTGGIANVTAKQVEGLATALSLMSGINDEVVQGGENMLLTFTNIRNEMGKGNDIFDQATKATLDLSVAMGKDMTSSAILVGKALNDPISGLGALHRVGVQFTEGQKDAIKAMVEAGDTMGAQKIILSELTTEFGGSAKAAGESLPGAMNKAKNAFDEVAGKIMTALMPAIASALQGFADFLTWAEENWPKWRQAIQDAWVQVKPTFDAISDAVRLLASTIQTHWDTISRNLEALKTVFETQFKIIRDVIQLLTDLLRGDWSEAWNEAKQIVQNFVTLVTTILTTALENFKQLAVKLGKAIYNGIVEGVTGIGEWLLGVMRGLLQIITDKIATAGTAAENFGKAVYKGIVDGITGIGEWVLGTMRGLVETISGKIADAASAALGFGKAIYKGVVDGVTGIGEWLLGTVNGLHKIISNAIEGIGNAAERFGSAIKDGILNGIRGLAAGLENLLKAPINAIIDAWNDIGIPGFDVGGWDPPGPGPKIPGFSIPGVSLPDIPKLATGGRIERTGFAIVHRGETVVPAGRGGNTTINLTVHGFVGDEQALTDRVLSALRRETTRTPSLGLT